MAEGAGHDVEALEAVTSLVGKSLLQQQEAGDEPRFTMLETVREFAAEQMTASGELDAVRWRHAALFLVLAETAEGHLATSQRDLWLRRLDLEFDNFRAALAWSQGRDDPLHTFPRLAAALSLYWHQRTLWSEGRGWLEAALTANGEIPTALRAHLLDGSAVLAHEQRDYQASRERLEQSLELWQTEGNRAGEATSLSLLGAVAWQQSGFEAARAYHERSLAIRRELGDSAGIANVLAQLGYIAESRGGTTTARALVAESLSKWHEVGDDQGIGMARTYLGIILAE